MTLTPTRLADGSPVSAEYWPPEGKPRLLTCPARCCLAPCLQDDETRYLNHLNHSVTAVQLIRTEEPYALKGVFCALGKTLKSLFLHDELCSGARCTATAPVQ